jgi:RNA polymerase sigma factor (TIGR02999 family)
VAGSQESVARLLGRWNEGDEAALDSLIPLVYRELHRLAHHYLRGEKQGLTLQSTALVHEAYMRLVSQSPGCIQDRSHFVAIAARIMRQILVDHARTRRAAKRGPEYKLDLEEASDLAQNYSIDIIALNDALNALSQHDPQQERIVTMRFFGGLTVEETASILGISPATVKRDWVMAKAWLTRELGKIASGKDKTVGAS